MLSSEEDVQRFVAHCVHEVHTRDIVFSLLLPRSRTVFV